MIFESYIPTEEDESVFYAESVTVDSGGIDLKLYDETYSASFVDVDKIDVALAILEDDFKEDEERAQNVLKLGTLSTDALERLGWVYMRASQIKREMRDQKRVASLEPALV